MGLAVGITDHLLQVVAALERAGGERVEAARQLGIERTTLYRLMQKYGLS